MMPAPYSNVSFLTAKNQNWFHDPLDVATAIPCMARQSNNDIKNSLYDL